MQTDPLRLLSDLTRREGGRERGERMRERGGVTEGGRERGGVRERKRERETNHTHLHKEFSQRADDDVPCPVLTAGVRVAEVKREGSRH